MLIGTSILNFGSAIAYLQCLSGEYHRFSALHSWQLHELHANSKTQRQVFDFSLIASTLVPMEHSTNTHHIHVE
jgi:hypothetical protein